VITAPPAGRAVAAMPTDRRRCVVITAHPAGGAVAAIPTDRAGGVS
jgi:hypothetical protein